MLDLVLDSQNIKFSLCYEQKMEVANCLQKPCKFIANINDILHFAKKYRDPWEIHVFSGGGSRLPKKLEIPSENWCFGGSKTAKSTKKCPRHSHPGQMKFLRILPRAFSCARVRARGRGSGGRSPWGTPSGGLRLLPHSNLYSGGTR